MLPLLACLLAVTAAFQNMTTDGKMNYYHVAATVKNNGSSQPSNTKQFVDVYLHKEKLDAKGIPPLAQDGVFTYVYTWKRSADAGSATTPLTFAIDPSCSQNQEAFTLTI